MLEISSRDVREGKVPSKVLPGGIVVPPGLQTNALTLREHQDYLNYSGHRRLTRAEAELIGHRTDEVATHFPAIAAPPPAAPSPAREPATVEILPPPPRPPSPTDRLTLSLLYGYEGEACRECGNFTLVRSGTCLSCNTCGTTTGCS